MSDKMKMQKGEIMSEWADMPSARDVAEEQVCRILRLMYRSNKHKRPIQELCFETWAGVRVIEYPHNQMHSDCRKLESGVIIDESPKEIKLSMAFFNHKIDGIKARIPLRLRTFAEVDVRTCLWLNPRVSGSKVECWAVVLSIMILPQNFDGFSIESWVELSGNVRHAEHLYDITPVVDFPPPLK